jgi:hypothetical protein
MHHMIRNTQSINQMKQAKSHKRTIDMITLKTVTIQLNYESNLIPRN